MNSWEWAARTAFIVAGTVSAAVFVWYAVRFAVGLPAAAFKQVRRMLNKNPNGRRAFPAWATGVIVIFILLVLAVYFGRIMAG